MIENSHKTEKTFLHGWESRCFRAVCGGTANAYLRHQKVRN